MYVAFCWAIRASNCRVSGWGFKFKRCRGFIFWGAGVSGWGAYLAGVIGGQRGGSRLCFAFGRQGKGVWGCGILRLVARNH